MGVKAKVLIWTCGCTGTVRSAVALYNGCGKLRPIFHSPGDVPTCTVLSAAQKKPK
ncbi:hypothetical protein GL2_19400 [Microbulbifer sp. GL-2]|nr:hypothetical protein GL2_19400 [Microbulbifer sp. GL-2]